MQGEGYSRVRGFPAPDRPPAHAGLLHVPLVL